MHSIFQHAQYSMVFINCVAILILLGILVFYQNIYPKKKISLFVLLLLISILPIISIFRPGSYQRGDLSLHVKYAMPFYENIVEGNMIPQWSGQDCSSYGCPEYMFIFFLPYYLIAGLHAIGLPFIQSVKALLIVSFFASGIGMYLWIKNELGKIPGFVAAVFYLFAPYHLIDMHFRVSIGEITCYAILPFAFLFIKKFIQSRSLLYFLVSSVALSALILSHQPTALFSFPIIFLYGLLIFFRGIKRKYSTLLGLFGSFLLSILLTTFYWLPLLFNSKYIAYSVNQTVLFFPIIQYLYAPVRLGFLFQGHKGELYTIVGYTQLFIILLSLFLLVTKQVKGNIRILLIYFLAIFFILFTFMQSFSQPLWNVFSFIKNIQFAYRIMLEISLAISVLAGIVAKTVPNKTFITILCLLTVLSTILNWGNRQNEPTITDTVLYSQPIFQEKPGFVEVSTPIWINRNATWIGKKPQKPIQILSGKAKVIPLQRLQTVHTYKIITLQKSVFKENTYYFPGWKLFVNNKEVPINYLTKQYKGIITFPLQKGIYTVTLRYEYTPISLLAQRISIVSGSIFLLLLLLFLRLSLRSRKLLFTWD